MDQKVLEKRRQQVLYDKKWRKFLGKTWVFRFFPFVEFVLAAGSLATGDVNEDSDFDVIIAAKKGRIFTVRFFTVVFLSILGWRRKKWHSPAVEQLKSYVPLSGTTVEQLKNSSTHELVNSSTTDKICLNHFVTEKSYRLSPAFNPYWRSLYRHLVPVFGDTQKIRAFWLANKDWMREIPDYQDDLRHRFHKSSEIKIFLENILSGSFGDILEKFLRFIQVKRIEASIKTDPPGYKPRIRYSDEELEFHPDTRRIEAFLKKKASV